MTVNALCSKGISFKLVIEPQELSEYSQVIDKKHILTLPFSNLGQGSIPARNWVWEHAIGAGAQRHWILDDNIREFSRFHNSIRIPVDDATGFRVVEDLTDRFENVGISGMNYTKCVIPGHLQPPFYLNTRIYSIILLDNSLPFRWRGRYNEDTDLSLRVLKSGLCTILVNAFLADKQTTMTMKGGNTDELYKGDGRLLMAQSLVSQHPDVTTIVEKWGRYQHKVDYRPFSGNKLIFKKGISIKKGTDNYGLKLTKKGAA